MSWRPCGNAYEPTEVISTSVRLPTLKDGRHVFAREHNSERWFKTRWSDVTGRVHAEWRRLQMRKKDAMVSG